MRTPDFIEPEFPKYPTVSFLHDSFMVIDNDPLELPDLTPQIFDAKIRLSIDAIKEVISRHQRLNSDRKIALEPVLAIKIGRLSVLSKEDFVLSSGGLARFSRRRDPDAIVEHPVMEDLASEYYPFWQILQAKRLKPIVESNIHDLSPAVDGTWLSVQVKK